MELRSHSPKKAGTQSGKKRGFTIVEVAAAGFVMAIALCSTLYAMTRTFKLLESARNSTLAGQIMQSEIERIRLQTFSDLSTQAEYEVDVTKIVSDPIICDRFKDARCYISKDPRGDVLNITVVVRWKDFSGTVSERSFTTRYTEKGLHDYYYTVGRSS
jgi:Tfp pilus assembly protein PilV